MHKLIIRRRTTLLVGRQAGTSVVRRTSVSRTAVVLAVSAMIGGPVQAATSYSCVVASSWSFTPPLGLANTSGTGSVDYDVICATAASDAPVAFSGGSAEDQRFTYTGNCELAVIGNGSLVAYLIGGTTYVQLAGPIPRPNIAGQQALWQLVPNQVCNESSASSIAVWTEAAG